MALSFPEVSSLGLVEGVTRSLFPEHNSGALQAGAVVGASEKYSAFYKEIQHFIS